MTVQPEVFADARTLGTAAAREITRAIEAHTGEFFLLGCPSGRSASSTYAALAAEAAEQQLDLSKVVIVMMDDYAVEGADGVFRRESAAADHSCERFGRELIDSVNDGLEAAHRIRPENLWLPDISDPAEYDDRIRAAGGVDLFLLASGSSDGHIAFNPPGSDKEAGTNVVVLPESTRRDNLATFPSFGGELGKVPQYGITVGVGTIISLSRSVLMLCHGEEKGEAVRRVTNAVAYEPDWPATAFVECARPRLFIDRAAERAADLQLL